MQVFMPYADFEKSVQALDDSRLRKQALESTQLLDIMFNIPTKTGKPRKGWMTHPALIAWQRTPGALIEHLIHNVIEIEKRGFKTDYATAKIKQYATFTTSLLRPIWLGDEAIHSSHRIRLLQKGFEEKFKDSKKADETIKWYSQFSWDEMNHDDFFNQEYFWATNITSNSYDLSQRVEKNTLKLKKDLIEKFGTNPFVSSV